MTRSDKLTHLQHDLNDARQAYFMVDDSLGSREFARFNSLRQLVRQFQEETVDLGLQLPYSEK